MSLADYNIRPVTFVRPTSKDTDSKEWIKKKNNQRRGCTLSGEEAKSFYESIISEPSTGSTNNPVAKSEQSTEFNTETSLKDRHDKRKDHRRFETPSTSTEVNSYTSGRLVNRFLRYAQCGELNELIKCYERGCDVDVCDRYSWTALMCAAHSGQEKIIHYLLQKGARKDLCNNRGQTATDLAHIAGHTNIVEMLLFEKKKPERRRKRKIESKFWCEVCKTELQEGNRADHQHSTVHQFNSNHKILPTQYGIPESNVGFQMMVKGGWDRDHGLGPQGTGQKYPVKTVLKRDREGLGANKDKKAKVTHFKPNDVSAVKITKKSRKESLPCMRPATISRKERERKAKKEKQWEIDFRISFNT